ncbi:LOW QUALITY PROTEIN: hypothetical protein PanWU01x14_266140, partial [Parasponia andersonii]
FASCIRSILIFTPIISLSLNLLRAINASLEEPPLFVFLHDSSASNMNSSGARIFAIANSSLSSKTSSFISFSLFSLLFKATAHPFSMRIARIFNFQAG